MAKSRQLENDGRWISFEAQSGMLWTFEGTVPRQGVTDYGDKKTSKHVGEAKVQGAIEKLAAAKLEEGWTETNVGWANAPAHAVAEAATAKPVKIAIPDDKVAKPAKTPTPAAIAKLRAKLLEQNAARATKAKLQSWSQISPLVRGSISMNLAAWKGTPPLGASRVGGAPDLDVGTTWPRTSRPLEFLAQLRCEELAAFSNALPKNGMLLFFADLSPSSSSYLEEGRVLYVSKLAAIARRPPPEGAALLAESAVTLSPTISLPPADGAFVAKAKLSALERETYNDKVLLPSLASRRHQVLGYPTLTEVEDAKADEQCLLQLASDPKRKLRFGDGQTLRFYARGTKLVRVRVTAEEL